MSLLTDLTISHFLVLAAALFMVGIAGVLMRRNVLIVMMSIELMLNAANITIVAFSRGFGSKPEAAFQGQAFALIVIAVAAAEAAVGLAIVMTVFRSRHHADIERLTTLRN